MYRSVSIRRVFCLGVVCLAAAAQGWGQNAAEFNNIGVDAYEAHRWPEAIKAFTKAYTLERTNDTLKLNLSRSHQAYASDLADVNDFDKAIRQLGLAIKNDPTNARAFVMLGSYYLHEGLVSDAIFRLEEAIELAPADVDGHFLLGEAYYRDNDVVSALSHWEWVNEVEPKHKGLAERLESARREEKVEYDFMSRSSRNFNVTFNPRLNWTDVNTVLSLLERARMSVGRVLGNTYPPSPIQVTLYSTQGFSESTQLNEHVGATYDGNKIRIPVVDASGNKIDKDELKRRLNHEYVHVVVRFLGKTEVPWWLNEGLAETLSRDMTPEAMATLRAAKNANALFDLGNLQKVSLEGADVDAIRLAYTQSHATVAYLKRRFGTFRFATMLQAIGDGEEPEAALHRVYRYTFKTLKLAVDNYIEQG